MAKTIKREGVVIMGHGSKSPSALSTLEEVTDQIDKAFEIPVRLASLQFNNPTFKETIDELVSVGVKRIIVMPFFIYSGIHVREDIPKAINEVEKEYDDLEIVLTGHLGADPSIIGVVKDRIESQIRNDQKREEFEDLLPHEIEAKSFEIILRNRPDLSSGDLINEVKSRIIHASGDIGIEKNIVVGPLATDIVQAMVEGSPVIADVNMVKAGINKTGLSEYGCSLHCFIDDDDVKVKAKESSKTRAAIAIRKAYGLYKGGIFVIGNAPTALDELCDLIERDGARPGAIIGTPVGFVGAAEAKERLIRLDIPWITVKGTRGGSAIAAASINAIIKIALKKREQVIP